MLLSLCWYCLGAQQKEREAYQTAANDYAPIFVGRLEPPFNSSQSIGHPYWSEDMEFVEGEVSYCGLVYKAVKMRYDALRHRLVLLMPDKNLAVEPDMDKIDYFVMNGKHFVEYEGVFVCLEHDGQLLQLMRNKRKSHGSDAIVDGKVKKTIEEKDFYKLVTADTIRDVKDLSDLQKAYPAYRKQLKAYKKANLLDFRRRRNKSLTEVTAYLESLLKGQARPLATRVTVAQGAGQKPDTLQLATWDNLEGFEPETRFPALLSFRKNGWEYEEMESVNTLGIGELEPVKEDHILDEVEVSGFQEKVTGVQMGVEKFRPALLKNIPLAMGELDVMKMIQTLPGIKTVGEASSGFNVRGGASDQNLILLNGGTVYNPMHLFGLFTAFNSDMINDAELYKSSIPSQYGGRISSVMNISPKIADKKKWHGSASLGLLTSKAYVEAPLVQDKLSLLLSGRTTYSDWMLKTLPKKSGYSDGSAGFYDLGGVLSWNISRRHRLNLHGYYSHDRFEFDPYNKYEYANMNWSGEWKSFWNEYLTSEVSAGMDHYDYLNDDTEVATSAARLSFAINQFYVKSLFTLKRWEGHTLRFGLNSQHYRVNPGRYEPIGEKSNLQLNELQQERAQESALFVEDEWKLTPKLSVNMGVRWSMFNVMGPRQYNLYMAGMPPTVGSVTDTVDASAGKIIKTYQAPEIRLSASYAFSENSSVKAAFNTMHQYIHKVSNTSIMSPTDMWKLSDANIRPQDGWQVAAGYYWQTENRTYEASAEVYYKQMSNYLTYRNSGVLIMNPHLETDVISTEGRAYGLELMLKKPTGMVNGWISYSYSRTYLRQNDPLVAHKVNDGDWFPTEYDRPHELKFVGNFKLTQRYSFSANADYSTGRPITIPAGQYYDNSVGQLQPYYTKRNGYRLPDYFRLDASFNIEPNHHLTQLTHSSFSIGVYNLLGRRNAYSVYYVVEGGRINGYKLSIFGAPIPFVSYNIKF